MGEGKPAEALPELPPEVTGDHLNELLVRARESYGEVLDATKHQDDKVGRFLTAIAFLASGTIALAFRTDLHELRYALPGGVELPLPAIFITGFLALVSFTVLLLILSIGPNLTLPKSDPSGRPRSYLFFLSMVTQDVAEWRRLWFTLKDKDEVQRQLLHGYVTEAHNIAVKADFKYSRTNEARAIFVLGLLSFAIAVVLAGNIIADERFQAHWVTPWTLRPRLLAAAVVALFVATAGYDWYRLEQSLDNLQRAGYVERWRAIIILTLAGVAYSVALVLPFSGWPRWIGLGVAVIAVRFGWKSARLIAPNQKGLLTAGALILAVLPLAICIVDRQQFALPLVLVPVVLLELPRALVASIVFRKRRAQHNTRQRARAPVD